MVRKFNQCFLFIGKLLSAAKAYGFVLNCRGHVSMTIDTCRQGHNEHGVMCQ